jgi:hydrogenase nickel incorporation protein HypA/HybF
VPLVVRCPRCEQDRVLPSTQSFRCPACGTPTPEIVRGRELELVALEVTDRAAPHR